MQELTAVETLKVMTIDQAQREHYLAAAARIAKEGPRIIAGIKDEQGAKRAVAWRLEVREFIRSVEAGALGLASAELHRRKKEIDAEMDAYIEPCKKLFNEAKGRTDRAIADFDQAIDLGKHKAAKAVMRAPLVFTPPTVEMPKIPNAVWKKTYMVTIEDMGELLAYIAANPKYHEWIKQEVLVAKLEDQAAKLAGNMGEFPGIKCFQGKSSAVVGGPK